MRTSAAGVLLMPVLLALSVAFGGETTPHFFKCIGGTSNVWGDCPEGQGCPTIRFRVMKEEGEGWVRKSAILEGSPQTITWLEEWGAGEFRIDCSCNYGLGHEEDDEEEKERQATWHVAATYTVGDIAGVDWVGYDPGDGRTNYEQGGNPAAMGGGDRIYAERNQPEGRAGDQLHDKIHIKATLAVPPPTGTKVKIHLKVFDPDHYSTDADYNPGGVTVADDNIAAGGQVVGAVGSAVLKTADFTANASFVELTGDGTASEVTIGPQILARQPSNNFIVVGHCSKQYVDAVVFHTDGKTLKESPDGPVVPSRYQTAMLTVWRTLYVEKDSMGDPDYAATESRGLIESGNITAINGNVMTTDVTIFETGGADQFEDGLVQLFTANNTYLGWYEVSGNTVGNNAQVTLTDNVPANAAKFQNLEDDDVAGGVTAADMVPDTSWWANRFEPACVTVNTTKKDLASTHAESVWDNAVAFENNIGFGPVEDHEDARKRIRANKGSACTNDFWVAYVLGAFQGPVLADRDPHTEDALMGLCHVSSLDRESGCVLYREATRDLAFDVPISDENLWRATSVHEAGHLFRLEDCLNDGKIMWVPVTRDAVTQEELDALTFSGAGLRKIIGRGKPGRPDP